MSIRIYLERECREFDLVTCALTEGTAQLHSILGLFRMYLILLSRIYRIMYEDLFQHSFWFEGRRRSNQWNKQKGDFGDKIDLKTQSLV